MYAPNIGTVYATIPNDGAYIIPFLIKDRLSIESELGVRPIRRATSTRGCGFSGSPYAMAIRNFFSTADTRSNRTAKKLLSRFSTTCGSIDNTSSTTIGDPPRPNKHQAAFRTLKFSAHCDDLAILNDLVSPCQFRGQISSTWRKRVFDSIHASYLRINTNKPFSSFSLI